MEIILSTFDFKGSSKESPILNRYPALNASMHMRCFVLTLIAGKFTPDGTSDIAVIVPIHLTEGRKLTSKFRPRQLAIAISVHTFKRCLCN